MDSNSLNTKTREKRARNTSSSISEADISLNESTKNKPRKKKSIGSRFAPLSDSNADSANEFEDEEPEQNTNNKEQNDNDLDIAAGLKEINFKLNNVLTKDSSELSTIIKNIVLQLKEEMLSSVILRIEKVESDIFDKEMGNNKLSQTISDMKCKLNEQKDENERLRKQLKQQESNCEMKINELEQYSRRSNISR
ncbi:hypothetical protein DPMN_011452 [Dreissena polymorpha]|uniref:Uncharacterized protein n=1 Tax=Dreissena polymorpha TaxID=45954 RepID=A0A9D4N1S3_DREPO|nr:hypothetical protein DPMN_011452 [Dreissena polymorpha]